MSKEQFLDEVVFGWIKKDLEKLLSIPSEESGIGNINFPIAFLSLSYMINLGDFLIGEESRFEKSIEQYLKCFRHPEEYNNQILATLFRNGLAHGYFPRGSINRSGKRPALYKEEGDNRPILDAETLARDFIESLDFFKKSLKDQNFENRKKQLFNEIESKISNIQNQIDRLPQREGQLQRHHTTYDPNYVQGFTGPSERTITDSSQ
jgi:hypothetical protein